MPWGTTRLGSPGRARTLFRQVRGVGLLPSAGRLPWERTSPSFPFSSPQEPSYRVASSPLRSWRVSPASPSAKSLWDPPSARLSLAAPGVPATVCQLQSRCPGTRRSQASAREAEPGRQSPGAPPLPLPSPAALPTLPSVTVWTRAVPSPRPPSCARCPDGGGCAGGSGAPALGRAFPELARPG